MRPISLLLDMPDGFRRRRVRAEGDRLTKAEFVEQANAVCAKYEQRVQQRWPAFPRRLGPAGQLHREGAAGDSRGQRRAPRAKPPEDLQGRYDRWMKIADAEVAAARKLHDALRKGDRQGMQSAFAELQTRDVDQDRLAREELGLTGCASGSSG